MQSHAAQYTGLCESEEQMSSVSDQLQRNVGKSCHTAVKGDKEMCGEANERKGDRQRGGKKQEREKEGGGIIRDGGKGEMTSQ